MDAVKTRLIEAEQKAEELFKTAEKRKLITPGKSETDLNTEILELAFELFGIDIFWHKRIVRSGPNTLQPYNENPTDLILQDDDILFFDFGPVFEEWEADLGRTYVIGNDPYKHKLKKDIESGWHEAKRWFDKRTALTGAEFYSYLVKQAKGYGWEFGGEIGGHLIGKFPHERLEPNNYGLYVHPGNHNDMLLPDTSGNKRNWILEIHYVDRKKQIGGFFEQLLT